MSDIIYVMAKHASHILEMARKGAEHKYQELKAEIAVLVKNFPHLGGSRGRPGRKVAQASAEPARAPSSRTARKRHKMSAAGKKAVSLRMKKYWAAKRKG